MEMCDEGSFTVDGYVDGPNLGSTEKGSKFVITKNYSKREETEVTIPSIGSLPSYCKWVLYRIVLQKPKSGSIYTVYRVERCDPRKVYKKDVEKYLIEVRHFENGRVKEALKLFDSQIKSLEHVEKDVMDLIIRDVLINALGPAFRPDLYFDLLPFFTSKFLLRLSDIQLVVLAAVMVDSPYIFCF